MNQLKFNKSFFSSVINYCGYSLSAPLPPHTAPCSYPFFHCTANCHVQEAHEEPSKIQDILFFLKGKRKKKHSRGISLLKRYMYFSSLYITITDFK